MLRNYAWSKASMGLYRMRSRWAVPVNLGVCVTNQCNLKCVYCMRETFKPPKGMIWLEDMKDILSRSPSISGVCIMGLCEPMLNPDMPAILTWLKSKGYSISFTTNGTVPFSLEMLNALTCVDDMAISIDSVNPEVFRAMRGTSLDGVLKTFQSIITYKLLMNLRKYDKPPVHVNAVITPETWPGIPKLIRFFEHTDITYLMFDPCTRPDFSRSTPFVLNDRPREFEKYRKIAHDSPLNVMGFDWMFVKSTNWKDCSLAWYSPFIHPNGDVYFCYKYDYILGNIYREDLLRIWNNGKAKAFRKALRTDTPPLQQCHTCNFARPKWQPGGDYEKNKRDSL